MPVTNLLIESFLPQTGLVLQIARFMFTLGIGIIVTRLVLVPLVDRATERKATGKKVKHQFHNLTLVTGMIFSLAAALQAGQFGGLVTIVGAVAAALTVAIGWGMRDEVSNYVAGTIIHLDSPYVRGDYVQVGEEEGEVKDITLRSTILSGHASDHIVVPNSKLGSNFVKNFTRGTKTKSSVAFKAKPEQAEKLAEILESTAVENEDVLEHPNPDILYRGFDDDKLNFELRYWVKDSSDAKEIKSDVLQEYSSRAVEAGLLEADKEEET